jgi:hypothetical protein
MAALLASLILQSGKPDDWQSDQLQWTTQVRDACGSVECLEMAYRSRIESLRLALDSHGTKPSAGRGNAAAAAKRDLLQLSERAAELARNSGAQDYLYRLCGMTAEADELRRQLQQTSALFYEYGKYVLDVELPPFRQAMDSFAAGQRDARMKLVDSSASAGTTCTNDVMRAARARYEVEENAMSYRADLLIAMAKALAAAKNAKEAASGRN